MRASAVVVLHLREEHLAQVSLTEYDDMIKGTRVGSSRSAVQHVHSAMAIVAALADHAWSERVG
jgi:hypothetical protein